MILTSNSKWFFFSANFIESCYPKQLKAIEKWIICFYMALVFDWRGYNIVWHGGISQLSTSKANTNTHTDRERKKREFCENNLWFAQIKHLLRQEHKKKRNKETHTHQFGRFVLYTTRYSQWKVPASDASHYIWQTHVWFVVVSTHFQKHQIKQEFLLVRLLKKTRGSSYKMASNLNKVTHTPESFNVFVWRCCDRFW